jgi:hypothetical protein
MGTPLVIRFKERQDSRLQREEVTEQSEGIPQSGKKQESYGNRTKKKEK